MVDRSGGRVKSKMISIGGKIHQYFILPERRYSITDEFGSLWRCLPDGLSDLVELCGLAGIKGADVFVNGFWLFFDGGFHALFAEFSVMELQDMTYLEMESPAVLHKA